MHLNSGPEAQLKLFAVSTTNWFQPHIYFRLWLTFWGDAGRSHVSEENQLTRAGCFPQRTAPFQHFLGTHESEPGRFAARINLVSRRREIRHNPSKPTPETVPCPRPSNIQDQTRHTIYSYTGFVVWTNFQECTHAMHYSCLLSYLFRIFIYQHFSVCWALSGQRFLARSRPFISLRRGDKKATGIGS